MSYAGARYQPFAVVNSAFLTRQQACLCAHSYIACFELSGKSSFIWVYVVHYLMRILLSSLAALRARLNPVYKLSGLAAAHCKTGKS